MISRNQRVRDRNAREINTHLTIIGAALAADPDLHAVKVAYPLFEQQESGQWTAVGCGCAKTDCPPKNWGKHPLGKGWQLYGTRDIVRVEQWLREGWNIGLYTGPNCRVIGIDIDDPKVEQLMFPSGVPDTFGDEIRGKKHLFFVVPDGTDIASVPPTFDGGEITRTGSRQLVAPHALHSSGGKRRWNGNTVFLDLPEETLAYLQSSSSATKEERDQAKGPDDPGWFIGENKGRHPFLMKQGGRLRNLLDDEDALYGAIWSINVKRCRPPYDEAAIRKMAHDLMQMEGGDGPGVTINFDTERIGLSVRAIGSYKIRRTDWLWRNWLPMEEPCFIEGLGGVAKSTMVVDVAARLTRGEEMPDGSPHPTGKPMGVVWITTEDDPERVLLPRFIAAKANTELVHFVDGTFTMPEDIEELRAVLRKYPDTGMVFIDPIFSHLDEKTNPNSDPQMRRQVMQPLRDLCRSEHVTVLLSRHLNKNTGQEIAMRGSGSYGGTDGAARAVLFVMADPNDASNDTKIIGVLKVNYAKTPKAWRFTTVESTLVDETGKEVKTSFVVWLDECDDIVERIAARTTASNGASSETGKTRRDRADDAVRAFLEKHGESKADDVLTHIESNHALSEDDFKGARRRLRVTRDDGTAHQHEVHGKWHIRLPDQPCLKPEKNVLGESVVGLKV